MTNNEGSPPELWYRASPKNVSLFALIWLGEIFLILMLLKWMFHTSAKIYLFLIPWALLGSIMVLRPDWITRLTQALEMKSDRADKWNPPGFP